MKFAGAAPRRARKCFSVALAVLLVWAFAARAARADVTLALSADGYVGAWLVAGPFPKAGKVPSTEGLRPMSGAPVSDSFRWVRWTPADGGPGPLDLTRSLGKGADRGIASAILVLDRPFDGFFLLAVDGTVALSIDGRVAFERAVGHPRGAAFDPVPVVLTPGPHTVALELGKTDRIWALEARIVTRDALEPPRGTVWLLPGVTDEDAGKIAAHLARTAVTAGLGSGGYEPRLRVDFPRGVAFAPSLWLAPHGFEARFFATEAPKQVSLLDLPGLAWRSASGFVDVPLVAVPTDALSGGARHEEVHVRVGAEDRLSRFVLGPAAPHAVSRALTLHHELESGQHGNLADRDVVTATLETMVSKLGASVDAAALDADDAARRLDGFVDDVEAGNDPLHARTGVLDVALPSPLDGKPEPLLLHVPASYEKAGTTRYPLVVLLHGYDGTPERILTAFLGTDSRKPKVDGFILAPAAHGNAFYRGPGETSVVRAIDWALRAYPIDPDRVSIAGHSMGGTGAAELAFRYAGRFSTVAALAGYHSYFVRRDVIGRPLRDWEWSELTRWSPASFAENGRNMFLYVAQGTRDLPLVHSTVLADRYQSLGYSVKTEWPDSAHDVWRVVWADASMWPSLASRKRDPNPKRITLKTDSLRYANDRWVHVTAIDSEGAPAKLDAKVVAPDRIQVTTQNVSALSLDRPSGLVPDGAPVTVSVDGKDVLFGTGAALSAEHVSDRWIAETAPRAPHGKNAAVEGPIRDAFMGPLVFVYGTLDPRQTRAAREVAEHFRARYSGDAAFPLVPDTAVTGESMRGHSLFLVGSKDANRIVRGLDASLPLGIDGSGVRAGARRFDGDPELGFACIYPNPKNSALYVVMVEAANARGLFRSMSLPNQLPDFVIFDSALAPAAGEQVLGDARVRAAGYFDANWSLPGDLTDRIVVPKGRAASPWVAPWTVH